MQPTFLVATKKPPEYMSPGGLAQIHTNLVDIRSCKNFGCRKLSPKPAGYLYALTGYPVAFFAG